MGDRLAMGDRLHVESSSLPLQDSEGSFYHLDDPPGVISATDDWGAFGFPFEPHELANSFSPEGLDLEAFLSLDTADIYQDFPNILETEIPEYEIRRELLSHASGRPARERSPQSSCYSEDLHSIIPEHYGPGYWLSLCSPSGITWIQQSTGRDDFGEISGELTAAWAKQLRLERNEEAVRTTEPEAELAWKYTDAYFRRSVDSLFDVVHRPEFEHYLRGHLGKKSHNDDPAWYALRNAVYASGCRLYHSENHAASFIGIQEEAWKYFSNALSVHSELLLRSPCLRAVRALLAMALFAEGLGSPALGSGLIANAILVAQSLGLHRKVPNLGSPLDSKTLQRLWLFWAVYCCEKNIARRIGRASVIDDDDISCDIPDQAHSGSTLDPIIFKHIIQSCQISSRLCKSLMSAKSLELRPAKMLEFLNKFDKQLESWKRSLPIEVQPKKCLKTYPVYPNAGSLGIILIHCSYYDLLMVLHSVFSYPWITDHFNHDLRADLQAQIKLQITKSSELMVNAARNIIVMARIFEINGANTNAYMLHYPMHAFINLFIYIIKFPKLPSVQSDLALLDVAAGYFGQMDFVTGSKLSFPFTRDIATFAREAVASIIDE